MGKRVGSLKYVESYELERCPEHGRVMVSGPNDKRGYLIECPDCGSLWAEGPDFAEVVLAWNEMAGEKKSRENL